MTWIKGKKYPQMARKNGERHFGKYIKKGFLPERDTSGLRPHKKGEYIHSKETRLKISKANKGKIISKETRAKMRENRKKQIIVHSTNTKIKLRESALKRMLREQKSKGFTSLEIKLYKELKKRNIYFEKQKLINNRFLVDAFIPDKNLIIEVDGTYWHTLTRVIKKDKAENAYLKKCGFNLRRLSEDDINNIERLEI